MVDGDTVIVGDTRVRLKGVDAAERGTDLGEAARIVMMTIVDGGPLTCRLTGEKTWRREVGYCATADGVDINREIIEQGAALACPQVRRTLRSVRAGRRRRCSGTGFVLREEMKKLTSGTAGTRGLEAIKFSEHDRLLLKARPAS